MKKIKEQNKPTKTTVDFNEVETKAIKTLIEERLRRGNNPIKDIKGLCGIHDKLEVALLAFEQIPF